MSVIEDYLRTVEQPTRAEFERICNIIREIAPEAEEAIVYGMPGFRYKGKYLVGFAAFTDHLSLFPTPEPIEALRDRLSGYNLSKGTIQFTLQYPLSEQLIKDLIQHRLRSIGS